MRLRRALALAVVAAPLLLAAACASSSADGASPTTTAPATTLGAPTTLAPTTLPHPTTSLPDTALAPAPTHDDAMGRLMDAWKANDRVAAARIADPESVANLFTQSADGFALYQCDTGEFPTSNCNYRQRAKNLNAQITAEKRAGGWVITGVYMSTDG